MQKTITAIIVATHDFEPVNMLKAAYRCRTCGLSALPWPYAPSFLGENIECDQVVARRAEATA